MRVLIALSSFLLGASLADKLFNKLIPDVDFDNEDCLGDACFKRNQLLSIDRYKTNPSTGLAYHERSLAYANTQELLRICLPNVAKEAVADSFNSCKGKKMEDICVFTKRRWLVKDAEEESVANVDFLKTAFSGLGDEAVKKCLNIKEEAEEWDDEYEYYDYADYYDEYDYLEEGAGVERRIRREAGNGGNNKNGDKNKKNGKNQNNGGKGKGRKSKKGAEKKKSGKNNVKKGNGRKSNKGDTKKKSGKNNGGNGKGRKSNNGDEKKKSGKNKGYNNGNKKNGKGTKNSKPDDRKYVKNPSKNPTAGNVTKNVEKINARLNNLGLKKLPVKSTLVGLECMWNELEDILVKCGEQIVSNSGEQIMSNSGEQIVSNSGEQIVSNSQKPGIAGI